MTNDSAKSSDLLDDLTDSLEVVDTAENGDVKRRRVARLRLVWTERRLLVRAMALGFLLSLVVAFLIPDRYQSTTRLMPPDQDSGAGMGLLAALAGKASVGGLGIGGVASDLLGLKGSGALFVGILQSRTVQDDLISKFDLRRLYRDRRWEDARADLQAKTEIDEDRKTGIISVSVTDKSPQRAAAMATEYVDELNSVVTRLNTSSAHREREFLEERLGQVNRDLESAEKNFSEFASKNTAIDIPAQGKAMIEAAATLEGQLIAVQTELESLRQVYTNSNVRVRATQARVDELRRQMSKLGGQPENERTSEGHDDQTIYPSIRKLPVLGVDYADLFRQTKIQEAVFETLTQEYELAKVQEAKETPSVTVLDPANVPERKSYPHRALVILGGTLCSFIAGIAWIFGRSAWKQIDPQDPGKIFAHEIFETIKSHNRIPSHNASDGGSARGLFWRSPRPPRQSPSATAEAADPQSAIEKGIGKNGSAST